MSGGGISGYAAVHARVRAMYSTMLTPEAWTRLYETADFRSLITLLKETVYGPYLSEVEDQALTPRRVVYQIKGHLADTCITVIRLVPDNVQSLLTQFYQLYEIDNLKAILRGIITGASWNQVRYVLFPLDTFTVLPAQAMIEVGNVSAAVERLRGTPYYQTLSHAMERYTAEQSLFPLEVALDLAYWRALWSKVSRLQGQEHQQALRIIGALVDMNNLMWATRYRVYHHLSEEEIINYTVPFGYRTRDEDIRAIAAGADMGQIVARIYPDLTDVEPLLRESQSELPRLELMLQRHLAGQCQTAFVGYPFGIGIPLAYIVLKQLEIQDLTVLAEAKSLQLSPEVFSPHLVLNPNTQPGD